MRHQPMGVDYATSDKFHGLARVRRTARVACGDREVPGVEVIWVDRQPLTGFSRSEQLDRSPGAHHGEAGFDGFEAARAHHHQISQLTFGCA